MDSGWLFYQVGKFIVNIVPFFRSGVVLSIVILDLQNPKRRTLLVHYIAFNDAVRSRENQYNAGMETRQYHYAGVGIPADQCALSTGLVIS
ncbi:unnamed protein product [Sphagnum jensenii]|jgi:hypothetical protein|uniref:Photosystem II protein D1 n=1 Tax=Sphagnum jensenii TaxID=128206 RepID=A0ABP0WXJ5_9BRYO